MAPACKGSIPPEIEVLYQKRLLQMRDTTKGIRLAAKLRNLKQDDAVNEYGAQLVLPNIDLAVFQAAKDETLVEGEATKAGRTPFFNPSGFGNFDCAGNPEPF